MSASRPHGQVWLRRTIATVSIMLGAGGLLVGCGDGATTSGTPTPGPGGPSRVVPTARLSAPADSAPADARGQDVPDPVATVSDRGGPSWSGELGDTVQIDWYMQSTGETVSEQIAVIQVKRVDAPRPRGPYDWKYGIKVRLTSLNKLTARVPTAYQFLSLSDGEHVENGVSGLGAEGGPDPSRAGRSSVGWLYQSAEQGFKPTEVILEVSAWKARWSLK